MDDTKQNLVEPKNVAWVHFKNGRAWKFSGDAFLLHRTKCGTLYGIWIESSAALFKPIWIGRYVEENERKIWFTVEATLGVDYIDFECGARYYFNKDTINGQCKRHTKK